MFATDEEFVLGMAQAGGSLYLRINPDTSFCFLVHFVEAVGATEDNLSFVRFGQFLCDALRWHAVYVVSCYVLSIEGTDSEVRGHPHQSLPVLVEPVDGNAFHPFFFTDMVQCIRVGMKFKHRE